MQKQLSETERQDFRLSLEDKRRERVGTKVVGYTIAMLTSLAVIGWIYLKAYERDGVVGVLCVIGVKIALLIILIGQYFKKQKR